MITWIFGCHKNVSKTFVPKSDYHHNASVAVQKLKIIIDFLPQNHHFSHEFSGPDVTQTPTPLQKLEFSMINYWSSRAYTFDLRNFQFRKGTGQKTEFLAENIDFIVINSSKIYRDARWHGNEEVC